MVVDQNADVSSEDIFAVMTGDVTTNELKARRSEKSRAKKIASRERYFEREWEKRSTAELMSLRRQNSFGRSSVGTEYTREGEFQETFFFRSSEARPIPITEQEYIDAFARSNALFTVLGRREHVPNKIEGKEARRKAATAHHGPKKLGGSRKTIRERQQREDKLRWQAASRKRQRKRSWWL